AGEEHRHGHGTGRARRTRHQPHRGNPARSPGCGGGGKTLLRPQERDPQGVDVTMTASETIRQAEGRVLARPHYELVPIRGMFDAAESLPKDAFASVTCSPKLGLDDSLDFALRLSEQEVRVAVHLAA